MAHKITKISPDGAQITTLAGTGVAGFNDGPGAAAQFYSPCGIAVDINNNVYVADNNNNRIRKITPAGVVTTLAGSGVRGELDGQGIAATFSEPFALSIDGVGNLFIGEGYTQASTYRIRKLSTTGAVSTVVGPTFTDQVTGNSTTFRNPRFTAVAPDGTLYVSDAYRHTLFKVTGAANPVPAP